jgi:hypothetical protein
MNLVFIIENNINCREKMYKILFQLNLLLEDFQMYILATKFQFLLVIKIADIDLGFI